MNGACWKRLDEYRPQLIGPTENGHVKEHNADSDGSVNRNRQLQQCGNSCSSMSL